MRGLAACVVGASICTSVCGCTIDEPAPPPADLGTFPYNPLVYELDLAILAYQLHAQTMVWPIDPFYEEHAGPRGTPRDTFMASVREWAQRRGPQQVAAMAGLDSYRGPGVIEGVADNPTHDPILYNYSRIYPWSDAISNNDGRWTEYLVPRAITGRIRDVYVAARAIGDPSGTTIAVTQITPARADADGDATDTLCAFEGGTGDKGEAGQPASYSLMGFVLARATTTGYDVHITFRGSRSGSATRAATDALSDTEANGNPDWVTDLGWDIISTTSGAADVTNVGGVHRGFAHAMHTTLPAAIACLAKVSEIEGGAAPTNIYITGHSLGGGLAQHFASAMLLGETYGPGGPGLPDAVRSWPWPHLKLISFSAPRAGDFTWASALSQGALDSPFYDPSPIESADAESRLLLDPGIIARVHDASRPAAFRLLISTDPITTTKFGGDGTHVGSTVYVNGTSYIDWIGVVSSADHEPEKVRRLMTDAFHDARTPAIAWRYVPTRDLVPDRDDREMGTPPEMQKLAAGIERFYAERGEWFDNAAFERDVDLMFAIERGTASP